MNKLTIVVPTLDRHHFLDRFLEAYKDEDFDIIIVDASKKKYDKRLKSNVKYMQVDIASGCEQEYIGLNEVKTKYSVICCDDDFYIPNSLKKCVKFLDKNEDYSWVMGERVVFTNLNRDNKFTYYHGEYDECSVEQDDAKSRVKQFSIKNLVHSILGVGKTKDYKEIFEVVSNLNHLTNHNVSMILEYYIINLQLICGKVKKISNLHQLMEYQFNSAGTKWHLETQCLDHIELLKENIYKYAIKKNIKKQEAKEIAEISMKSLVEVIHTWSDSYLHHSLYGYINDDIIIKKNLEAKKYLKLVKKYNFYTGFSFTNEEKNSRYIMSSQITSFTHKLHMFFLKNPNEKFILYGAGDVAEVVVSLYADRIKFIVDKKEVHTGATMYEKKCYTPEVLKKSNLPILIAALGREDEIIRYVKSELKLNNKICTI